MPGDLAASDGHVVRGLCPRCSKRLIVDGLDMCLPCYDRAAMGRQTTLDADTLEGRFC